MNIWILLLLLIGGTLLGYSIFCGAIYYMTKRHDFQVNRGQTMIAAFGVVATPIWLLTSYVHAVAHLNLWINVIFCTFMIFFTITDLMWMLIPNKVIVAALISGINLKILFPQYGSLYYAVLAAMLGFLIMVPLVLFTRGGIGAGDAKLMAVCGLFLGWKAIIMVILLTAVLGAIFSSIMLLLSKLKRNQHIPYAPFIAVASWIVLNWQGSLKII